MLRVTMHRALGLSFVIVFGACTAACSLLSDFEGLTGGGAANDAAPVSDSTAVDTATDVAPDADAETGDVAADAEEADVEAGGDASSRCADGRGPKGVAVGSFCVDGTEVTKAQYAEFLASKGSDTTGQPAECAFNATYVPSGAWPALTGEEDRPVVYVDWCDATMFCRWAGKHLCGKIGGGSVPYDTTALVDASVDQWFAACSNGGTTDYPYGDAFDAGACNTASSGLGKSADVGSFAGCTGGVPGLFDLSGNVGEWEDSCESGDPANDYCRTRGGDFGRTASESRCDVRNGSRRGSASEKLGFRCCRD